LLAAWRARRGFASFRFEGFLEDFAETLLAPPALPRFLPWSLPWLLADFDAETERRVIFGMFRVY
jgi:hypothetical protein